MLKYFVAVTQRKKRGEKTLFAIAADSSDKAKFMFCEVKNKLPFIDKSLAHIVELYDTTNNNDFLELITKYSNYNIYFKILMSDLDLCYIRDTNIPISELNFHENPISAIHIQTKRAIVRDKEWIIKKEGIDEKIRSLLLSKNVTFSSIETSMLWEWDDVKTDMWETIMRQNDVALIFYDITINTIINLSRILYELGSKHNKYIYMYFVDNENNLYKIIVNESIEVVPVDKVI